MTTDLKALTYNELIALDKQVKEAIEVRKTTESDAARKEWLKCEKGGGLFVARIEALRKKYEKVAARCDNAKNINLRIQMKVELHPIAFEDLLQNRWEQSACDVFDSECSGKLLNPEACGSIATEIQDHIDSVMSDLCSDVIGIYGTLNDDLEKFIEEWNIFVSDFSKETHMHNLVPKDVVKAYSKKIVKPKGKK